AQLHRTNPRRRRAALIQGTQERHAPALIMFPAVLAVEDNADQRRGDRLHPPANVVPGLQKNVSRVLPPAALVVETDHVAQGMIAEYDAQLVISLADTVGTVEVLGVADMAVVVAADEALHGLGEHAFVGGEPADAVLRQERDHGLTDAALGGPQ